MGNSTGSVSNDGSWNARFNVAGSSHARIDVYENDDGIKATMYAHTGHTGPRFGSMSNHPVNFMCNGTNRATLTTAGSLSTTVQGTLWGTSSKFTAGSNLSWSGSTLNATDTNTNTTYSAGSGLSLSGTTFSHSDTSSQGSINLSGRQYIQDLTLDTYGHVTGYAYATETVTNTDTNTWRPVEAGGNTLSGSETLEFKSGSGISISESGGEVTLTCTVTDTNTWRSISDSVTSTSSSVSASSAAAKAAYDRSWVSFVATGTGLSGTVTSAGTISLALGNLADMSESWDNTADEFIVLNNGSQARKLSSEIFGLNAFTDTAILTTGQTNTLIGAYSGGIPNLTSAGCFGGASSGVTNQGLSRDVAYKIMNNSNSTVACVTTQNGSSEEYLRYKNGGNFSWETIEWNHIQGMSALDPLP